MEENLGKITWGYIWRLVVWAMLVSLVFSFVLGFILAANSVNDLRTVGGLISYYKKYLIGLLIIGLMGTVISCKFATSGIQKKFTIDSTNKKQVFKRIVIVLMIFLAIYVLSNIIKISDYKDELNKLNTYNTILDSTEEGELVKEFIEFSDTFVIVTIVSNVVVMLLMVPFEKKLLDAR